MIHLDALFFFKIRVVEHFFVHLLALQVMKGSTNHAEAHFSMESADGLIVGNDVFILGN